MVLIYFVFLNFSLPVFYNYMLIIVQPNIVLALIELLNMYTYIHIMPKCFG